MYITSKHTHRQSMLTQTSNTCQSNPKLQNNPITKSYTKKNLKKNKPFMHLTNIFLFSLSKKNVLNFILHIHIIAFLFTI